MEDPSPLSGEERLLKLMETSSSSLEEVSWLPSETERLELLMLELLLLELLLLELLLLELLLLMPAPSQACLRLELLLLLLELLMPDASMAIRKMSSLSSSSSVRLMSSGVFGGVGWRISMEEDVEVVGLVIS